MRKLVTALLMLSFTVNLSAQNVRIVNQYPIKLKEKSAHYPVLNKSGDKLLYSQGDYQTLFLYHFDNQKSEKIASGTNTGYDPIFTNDDKTVIFRNTQFTQGLRYDALESYRLEEKEQIRMIEPQRNLRAARSFHNGALVRSDNGLMKTTFGRTKKAIPTYVSAENLQIFVYENGIRSHIDPVKTSNSAYIWVSLSPDETKILFTSIGKGTFVSDLKGNVIAELGYLNAPVWYNNNWVVGMQDRDDGHQITQSQVLLKSINGKVEQKISRINDIALFPTASDIAGRIVYATSKGELVVTEIELK